MKIGLYCDNTLALPVEEFCSKLSEVSSGVQFVPRSIPLRLATTFVSTPATYRSLPSSFRTKSKTEDLSVIATAIPYDNNYFFEGDGSVVIVSFSNWHQLTDLPITNGLAYFLAAMLCTSGARHEENTGCINDFHADKRSVNYAMRSAFICSECSDAIQEESLLIDDLRALLELVGKASRANADVLDATATATSNKEAEFDVFLCHNSVDKDDVRAINARLVAQGVRTWFDEEQIRLGRPWQPELERQIKTVRASCVFVGANGTGPWQDAEIRAFLSQFVRRACPVIPVLLEAATAIPDLPLFLQEMMWLDLRRDPDNAFRRLVKELKATR